jgi:hypothetical protein
MKAITIYQPWASLFVTPVKTIGGPEIMAKRFETRGKNTNYRGEIAIHAAVKPVRDALYGVKPNVIHAMGRAFGVPEERGYGGIIDRLENLPRGKIIGIAELVDSREMLDGACVGLPGAICIDQINQYWSPNWQAESDEFLFGDWRPGRYAWEMRHVKRFDRPVPARGKQGMWDWDES